MINILIEYIVVIKMSSLFHFCVDKYKRMTDERLEIENMVASDLKKKIETFEDKDGDECMKLKSRYRDMYVGILQNEIYNRNIIKKYNEVKKWLSLNSDKLFISDKEYVNDTITMWELTRILKKINESKIEPFTFTHHHSHECVWMVGGCKCGCDKDSWKYPVDIDWFKYDIFGDTPVGYFQMDIASHEPRSVLFHGWECNYIGPSASDMYEYENKHNGMNDIHQHNKYGFSTSISIQSDRRSVEDTDSDTDLDVETVSVPDSVPDSDTDSASVLGDDDM